MWLDTEEAKSKIFNIEDTALRDAMTSLREDGFAVIPGVLTSEECEKAIEDYDLFCAQNHEEAEKFKMPSGFHTRLYNLHATSQNVRNIALNTKILNILDNVFPAKCALNSTLFFEQGSQQEIHRDTPFFTATPFAGEFVGVWYALEDVIAGAGPLVYLPKGHNLKVDIEKARQIGGHDVGEMFKDYCKQVQLASKESEIESKLLFLKKGDAAIWHAELPHGGSEITNNVSRKSIVAHYIPEGAYIQTVGYFFGIEGESKIMEFHGTDNNRLMRWNEKPIFMPNA
jgi:phytanoyl-CoA hydroxylase